MHSLKPEDYVHSTTRGQIAKCPNTSFPMPRATLQNRFCRNPHNLNPAETFLQPRSQLWLMTKAPHQLSQTSTAVPLVPPQPVCRHRSEYLRFYTEQAYPLVRKPCKVHLNPRFFGIESRFS